MPNSDTDLQAGRDGEEVMPRVQFQNAWFGPNAGSTRRARSVPTALLTSSGAAESNASCRQGWASQRIWAMAALDKRDVLY